MAIAVSAVCCALAALAIAVSAVCCALAALATALSAVPCAMSAADWAVAALASAVFAVPWAAFALVCAVVLENFGYRQLASWWRLAGLVESLTRRKGAWGKMKRSGAWTQNSANP